MFIGLWAIRAMEDCHGDVQHQSAYSFVNGTAANDTFNINALFVTAFGLDGDDQFSVANSFGGLSFDGGTGNDSFSLGSSVSVSLVSGGDGNDSVFLASGNRNNFSGDAGNDWIGIGGGASSTRNVLDGGDGDDWVGATAILGENVQQWAPMPSRRRRQRSISGQRQYEYAGWRDRQRQPIRRCRTNQRCGGRHWQRLARHRRHLSCSLRRRWQRLDRRDREQLQLLGGSGDDTLLGVGAHLACSAVTATTGSGSVAAAIPFIGDAGNDYRRRHRY